MEDSYIGYQLPRNEKTRIVKVNEKMLRLHVSAEWAKLLNEEDRERLAFGFSRELPGHLIIASSKDFNTYGYKSCGRADGSVCFTATTDPVLVKYLFPEVGNRIFVPRHFHLHIGSDGVKGVALEWTNSKEYLLNSKKYHWADETASCNLQKGPHSTEQEPVNEDILIHRSDAGNHPVTDDPVPFDVDLEQREGDVAERFIESDDQRTDDSVDSAEFNENNSEDPSIEQPDNSHVQNSEEGTTPTSRTNQDDTEKDLVEVF